MPGCDCAEELRLYRNLLALLPYTVRVQKVVVTPRPNLTSVVTFQPYRRRPGRIMGWF